MPWDTGYPARLRRSGDIFPADCSSTINKRSRSLLMQLFHHLNWNGQQTVPQGCRIITILWFFFSFFFFFCFLLRPHIWNNRHYKIKLQVSGNIQLVLRCKNFCLWTKRNLCHTLLCYSPLKSLEVTVPRDNSEVEEKSYSKWFFWDILYLFNSIKTKWSYLWNTWAWKKADPEQKSLSLVKE